MKNIIISTILLAVLFSIASCKNCYTCKPICYECKYLSSTENVCREDFDNVDDFNTNRNTYTNAGYICTEKISTSSKSEICGNSSSVAAANASTKANDGYRCEINK